jgi:hypothetical protein
LDKDEIYLENIKILVDLFKHDGKLYWDKFNIWLVLTSALLVATPYAQFDIFDIFGFELSKLVIPVLGLITSIVWLCTSSRSIKAFRHYIRLEREIEENHLKNVTIWKREDDLEQTYRFYERVSIMKMALVIPFAFFVIFLLLLLLHPLSLVLASLALA